MAQIAEELDAGVTQGIIRNIRTKSACARVLRVTKEAAAAALLPNTMGKILAGFAFFTPKYGLRSKENFSLYSPNLMWMPGQNRVFFDSNFCRIFLRREKHLPKAGCPGRESRRGRDCSDAQNVCLVENSMAK